MVYLFPRNLHFDKVVNEQKAFDLGFGISLFKTFLSVKYSPFK